jgi:hypothetical protein
MRLPQLSPSVERRSLAVSPVGSPRGEILPQAGTPRDKIALVTWGRKPIALEHIHSDCEPQTCTSPGDECKGLLNCPVCDPTLGVCVPS